MRLYPLAGLALIALTLSCADRPDDDAETNPAADSAGTVTSTTDEATQLEESLVGRDEPVMHLVSATTVATTPAERGEAIWRAVCAKCHVSPKGFDIAHFQYPDSVIMRRGLTHNDSASVWDVIAHIRSLAQNDTMTPKRAPFQPGNIVLASDQEFAQRLFGSDMWPADLTRDQLLQQDPLTIPVPLRFPFWSDEGSNYDWLAGIPHDPLPDGVRAAIQNRIQAYLDNPSMTTVSVMVRAARTSAHNLTIPDAPCRFPQDVNGYDAARCFDVGKWGSVALYTEMLRQNNLHGLAKQAADQWWETGHDAHKAQQHHKFLANRDLNIAGWMHISWIFNPSMNKASTYETGPLAKLGYRRMATWVSLRSQVARRPDSLHACGDVYGAAMDGFAPYQINAIDDGYRELQFRKRNNMLNLSASNTNTCVDYIKKTQQRLGTLARAKLQPLADSTILIVSR